MDQCSLLLESKEGAEGNSDLFLSELKATQDIDFPSLSAIPLPALPPENLECRICHYGILYIIA